MRYIEVRRHTMRHKPGKHLTQAGVELARRVGNEMGPFARVLTSKLPRAFETAIAMGFAVDDEVKELSLMTDKAGDQMMAAETNTLADYARAIHDHKALGRWAVKQAKYWRSVADALQEGECALLVSHGGMMELGTVAALPEADHAAWGPGYSYCEGVRLSYDGNAFVHAEILRVPLKQPATRQEPPGARTV